MKFDYLIIGSGIAGISAVETLRKFNKEASIGLISNEPHQPYSKVLLPFYLKGKINYDQLFIRGQSFWKKNNILFIYGEVSELDRQNKIVRYTDLSVDSHRNPSPLRGGGELVSYGTLLVASGANAKKLNFLGNDLSEMFYFRDLDETVRIKKYFENLHSNTLVYQSDQLKPVIYGASFIALEFAGIFAHFGISAKIIFRGPYFWSRLLDPQGGELVENFLEQAGMEIHDSEEIKSINPVIARADEIIGPRQSLFKIETGRDSYQATFLGLGVGLEPNLEFARVAGLKINQGIITDEFLQTSDPDIFAAGDIAEFYDTIINRHHVLGNWLNSDMQGRAAAHNMLGVKKPFELVSFYNFNFEGKKGVGAFNICALGDTNPQEPFDARTSCRSKKYARAFIKNNQCVGIILINSPQLREKCANFIKNKLEPARLDSLLDL